MSNRKIESRSEELFGNLKVRPKLMVLHNLFFLVLTTAAYFSLIPLYEQLVTDTEAASGRRFGTHSGGEYRRRRSSRQRSALTQARVRLFLVLGIIYMLAVLLLESAIMPLYVYGRCGGC